MKAGSLIDDDNPLKDFHELNRLFSGGGRTYGVEIGQKKEGEPKVFGKNAAHL